MTALDDIGRDLEAISAPLAPWKATLYLQVRSKGRPGQPNIENRVYTSDVEAREPDLAILKMVRYGETFAGTYISTITWHPTETNEAERTAIFRESLRRSDRLVDELESYGWTRRRDLEQP